MTDWRDLEAGRGLDLEIGKLVNGWSVKVEELAGDRVWQHVIDRDGNSVEFNEIPHYSTDANAALALPIPDGWWWEIEPKTRRVNLRHEHGAFIDTSLPVSYAIVRVWLLWHEQQQLTTK